MASITVDSELMTNIISAVPVAKGGHFVTVLDENRRPMVFCMSGGTKPILQLLRRDREGKSELLALNDILRVPSHAVIQTFEVVQSWALDLFMCVVWHYESSTELSKITVPIPFKPSELKSGSTISDIIGYHEFGWIEKLFMAPVAEDTDGFPDIYITHKALDQATQWGSDITTVHVNPENGWRTTQALAAPENITGILDLATAISAMGNGLYVLYHNSKGESRIFARYLYPDEYSSEGKLLSYVTNVQCPKDAYAITTFLNEDDHSCLLIAASDGIHLLSPTEAVNGRSPGKLVYTDTSYLKGVRELRVCQDKSAVTMWFNTADHELGYVRTSNTQFDQGITALITSASTATTFSAATAAPSKKTGKVARQFLITVNDAGALSLLEQSSDLGLWRTSPFYAPSSTEATELRSYTVSVKAKLSNGEAARNASVFLSSSSTISGLLNGSNVLFSQQPAWFECDAQGALDFIIPTDSLNGQTLFFEQLKFKGKKMDFKSVRFNPTTKVMNKMSEVLSSLSHGRDLTSLKTQSGEKLIGDTSGLSDDDLESARQSLAEICKAYEQLPSYKEAVADSPPGFAATASRDMEALITFEPDAVLNIKSLGDLAMDGWEWLKSKLKEARDWIVRKAGDVWEFVCKIGDEVKKFVLNCVETVCEAASWLWEKLKVGWKKLCDWIGFIFNWGDILETQDTVALLIDNGLVYASNTIVAANKQVDQVCDSLINEIDSWVNLAPKMPVSDRKQDQKVHDAQNSSACQWAGERLKNGGAGTGTKMNESAKPSLEAQKVWDDIVSPALSEVNKQLANIGKEVTDLFKDIGSISAEKVIKAGAGVLKAGINSVREVIKTLITLAAKLVLTIRNLANTPINVPIFTWLYKKITGGKDFTLLGALSLILAIPTTIFAKVVTGKKPPQISQVTPELFGQLFTRDEKVDKAVQAKFDLLLAEGVVGYTLITGVFGVLKLLWKTATGGTDKTLDGLKADPPTFFDLFGIVGDMISTIIALPEKADQPGANFRRWTSYVSCARGICHTVFFFVPSNPVKEKVVLALDLVTVLANLGLSIAVFDAELKAKDTWKDFDQFTTDNSLITNVLTTTSGVAYFTAFFFRDNQPEIAGVGLALMLAASLEVALSEGILLRHRYDLDLTPRIASGPPY